MKITFSILCYNYGRFLSQAIESCLIQHVEGIDCEVLVIDDGSTDNTAEVCANYKKRIRVISEGNQGFASSLTRAIEHAGGDYVFLLDADDFFLPGKLEAFLPMFQEGKLFVYNRSRMVNEFGEAFIPNRYSSGSTSTIAVNKMAAIDLLPVENEISFHVIDRLGHGKFLDAPLTSYRLHDKSMTDRQIAGRQNTYLAGVTHRLADRINALATSQCRPAWMHDQTLAKKVAAAYHSQAYYNELEASLELRERVKASENWILMALYALKGDRGLNLFEGKMLLRTLALRASFPKSAPGNLSK